MPVFTITFLADNGSLPQRRVTITPFNRDTQAEVQQILDNARAANEWWTRPEHAPRIEDDTVARRYKVLRVKWDYAEVPENGVLASTPEEAEAFATRLPETAFTAERKFFVCIE